MRALASESFGHQATLLDYRCGDIGLGWLAYNTVLKVDKDEGRFTLIKLQRHFCFEGRQHS
jgi:hypothetical protein